ncbi:hypothetical protein GF325_02855 [Candidatus Bathyarchaeota archaeon]|nr:hypothetical protein [Candidatus Bathyarchaeota archaeon]
MPISKATLSKIIAVVSVVGVASAGIIIGAIFSSQGPRENVVTSVTISEIKYRSTLPQPIDEQFMEIYVHEDVQEARFSKWSVEIYGASIGQLKMDLPAIDNVSEFWHLTLKGTNGTLERDIENRSITIHLNLTGSIFLDLVSGQVRMIRGVNVVDAVGYAGGSGMVPGWPAVDGGKMVNNDSHSLNIWGPDVDNSSNWYSDMPTPGGFNNLHHIVEDWVGNGTSDNITITMYNGFINANMNYTQMFYPMLPPVGPGIPMPELVSVDNHPTSGISTSDVKEYVSFTMRMIGEAGLFPNGPQVNDNGSVEIHIGKSDDFNSSSGITHADGKVYITVGNAIRSADPVLRQRGKYDVKYTIEHEIIHVFQMENSSGFRAVQDPNNNAWTEGEAVYWGQKSAAANFGISVAELNDEMSQIQNNKDQPNTPPQNWEDHGNNTNIPWWGNGDSKGMTTWLPNFDFYQLGALMVKFIIERFGNETYKNITNSLRNKDGGGTQPGEKQIRDALAENCGMSFEALLMQFYLWRCTGEAESANSVSEATVTDSFNYTGSGIAMSTTYVAPLGAAYETINVTNPADPPFGINITANPNNNTHGNYSVGVVSTLRNGTKVTSTFTIEENASVVIPIDPLNVGFVEIIKMNLNDTHVTEVGLEIIVMGVQAPSIPPHQPPPDIHPTMSTSSVICDGYRGTEYDGYFCIMDTSSTIPQPYITPGLYNITFLDVFTDLVISDNLTSDMHVRFWKYNIDSDMYYDETAWQDTSIPISVELDILPGDISASPPGVFVVAEFRDFNPAHTLTFFQFTFDAVFG